MLRQNQLNSSIILSRPLFDFAENSRADFISAVKPGTRRIYNELLVNEYRMGVTKWRLTITSLQAGITLDVIAMATGL